MKFINVILKEGRKEDLKKKYSNKFSQEDLDFILNISDLVDFNHKYTDFVLREIDPNTDIAWWAEKIIGDIKIFDKYQSQLQKKDINQYSDYYELQDAIFAFQVKEKEKELEKQVDKIYEDDKMLVVKPKTLEASCKYGSGTKWCTTTRGANHFERYTMGSQGLYYIINKADSSDEDYSKVAIHFDNLGTQKYYDSKDLVMSDREVKIFNYVFPEIIKAIKENYKLTSVSATDKLLHEAFNIYGDAETIDRNYMGSQSILKISVNGFRTIDDLGPGHAEGNLAILLNNQNVDEYEIYVTFGSERSNTFKVSIGFMGIDPNNQETFIDTELENFGIDGRFQMPNTAKEIGWLVRNYISGKVMEKVKEHPKLIEKTGVSKVWRPYRFGYGYTFAQNKGLIKKLVEWLDSSKVGTKLDFLVDIGKLDRKLVNNRAFYSHKGRDDFKPSADWRGHFASFFASAKMAGILKYRKVSNQFLLMKGPNFEAFKKGELKPL